MSEYAVLVEPSANRVYAAEAPRLLAAELDVLLDALTDGDSAGEVREVSIAGLPYVRFDLASDDRAAEVVAASSASYGLYRISGEYLVPVALPRTSPYSEDLVTIQKYTGKTNEQFTSLLMNLTLAASARPQLAVRGKARILDPVCGRGTTLNLALRRGFEAFGIDVDRKDVEAYSTFLKTWARTHRLPHTHSFAPVRRNKRTLGERLDVELFADRQAQKESRADKVSVVVADTTATSEFFKPGSMDAIVGDLPYGVAHGSHRGHDLDRRADDLVASAMPTWSAMLRPGGAIGLSFNTKTLRRADVEAACQRAGLRLAAYGERFAHRVDSSITRDLVVAIRDN